jgi:hypothetical protein
LETISISDASSVTAGALSLYGIALGGFDGPFVAVFPEAVHSPRLDDVHDRKRGKVHVRGRDRRAGLCAIPDHRRRTQGPFEPELALGELYMEGTFVVERGSIADALAILLDQPEILPRWAKLQWWLRYLARHARHFNPRGRSKNNVARHYDLDGRLYSLFLDADKQYSCAYFETPDTPLDDAQLAKKRHIAAKLADRARRPGPDIGSGWGGLGL